MRIGIDISQTAYQATGVANLLKQLIIHLLLSDEKNTYVLFFSSLRGHPDEELLAVAKSNPRVSVRFFRLPPSLLDLLWNRFHILPIETFVGNVDLFISSDWTQPPTKAAHSVTILYDLIVYKYPSETAVSIVTTQKRRLEWVKKECEKIICISDATRQDAMEILNIPQEKLAVVYPGVYL